MRLDEAGTRIRMRQGSIQENKSNKVQGLPVWREVRRRAKTNLFAELSSAESIGVALTISLTGTEDYEPSG